MAQASLYSQDTARAALIGGAPHLPDPAEALADFEQALISRSIALQPGALDKTVHVHLDRPGGYPRVTFVRLVERRVTAFAQYVPIQPIQGISAYAVGYAVPRRFRRQGRAKSLVTASAQEMQLALAHHGIARCYIEAMVPIANLASQHVAAATLNPHPNPFTDAASGEPWLQYLRLMP